MSPCVEQQKKSKLHWLHKCYDLPNRETGDESTEECVCTDRPKILKEMFLKSQKNI